MDATTGLRVRWVVTGHSAAGQSVVAGDGSPPRVTHMERLPGLVMTELWATDDLPAVPVSGDDPTTAMTTFVPRPGGTRFRLLRFPPDRELAAGLPEGLDPQAAGEEFVTKAPGDWNFDPAHFGMHTTNTVDYLCVLSGEIFLELDDGAEVLLRPGDCIVQNGTRHAWRNRGTEPCVLLVVLVGAVRA